MTDILLFGSFHFQESDFDFFTEDSQNELNKIVLKLAKFNPDKIALEAPIHQQNRISEFYNDFQLVNFDNYGKMKNEILGTITSFGESSEVSYKNESIQVAYRLGKILKHKSIFAIDDDSDLDETKLMSHPDFDNSIIENLGKKMNEGIENTILGNFVNINSKKWSDLNQLLYLKFNQYKLKDEYVGADFLASWYERNLKIFANIQNLCMDCERLFIIYGGGHLYILRELIKAYDEMNLVDINNYL